MFIDYILVFIVVFLDKCNDYYNKKIYIKSLIFSKCYKIWIFNINFSFLFWCFLLFIKYFIIISLYILIFFTVKIYALRVFIYIVSTLVIIYWIKLYKWKFIIELKDEFKRIFNKGLYYNFLRNFKKFFNNAVELYILYFFKIILEIKNEIIYENKNVKLDRKNFFLIKFLELLCPILFSIFIIQFIFMIIMRIQYGIIVYYGIDSITTLFMMMINATVFEYDLIMLHDFVMSHIFFISSFVYWFLLIILRDYSWNVFTKQYGILTIYKFFFLKLKFIYISIINNLNYFSFWNVYIIIIDWYKYISVNYLNKIKTFKTFKLLYVNSRLILHKVKVIQRFILDNFYNNLIFYLSNFAFKNRMYYIYNKCKLMLKSLNWKYNIIMEYLFAFFPTLIIIFLIFPSFYLLYSMDIDFDPKFSIKIMGNQWYWDYEIDNMFVTKKEKLYFESYNFSSIIIQNVDLYDKYMRLLEVDKVLSVPIGVPVRFLVSSTDVLHAWAIPSMGIKVDAVPGRLNQFVSVLTRPGFFFGQCSELCGVGHSFMPIKVEGVSLNDSFFCENKGELEKPEESNVLIKLENPEEPLKFIDFKINELIEKLMEDNFKNELFENIMEDLWYKKKNHFFYKEIPIGEKESENKEIPIEKKKNSVLSKIYIYINEKLNEYFEVKEKDSLNKEIPIEEKGSKNVNKSEIIILNENESKELGKENKTKEPTITTDELRKICFFNSKTSSIMDDVKKLEAQEEKNFRIFITSRNTNLTGELRSLEEKNRILQIINYNNNNSIISNLTIEEKLKLIKAINNTNSTDEFRIIKNVNEEKMRIFEEWDKIIEDKNRILKDRCNLIEDSKNTNLTIEENMRIVKKKMIVIENILKRAENAKKAQSTEEFKMLEEQNDKNIIKQFELIEAAKKAQSTEEFKNTNSTDVFSIIREVNEEELRIFEDAKNTNLTVEDKFRINLFIEEKLRLLEDANKFNLTKEEKMRIYEEKHRFLEASKNINLTIEEKMRILEEKHRTIKTFKFTHFIEKLDSIENKLKIIDDMNKDNSAMENKLLRLSYEIKSKEKLEILEDKLRLIADANIFNSAKELKILEEKYRTLEAIKKADLTKDELKIYEEKYRTLEDKLVIVGKKLRLINAANIFNLTEEEKLRLLEANRNINLTIEEKMRIYEEEHRIFQIVNNTKLTLKEKSYLIKFVNNFINNIISIRDYRLIIELIHNYDIDIAYKVNPELTCEFINNLLSFKIAGEANIEKIMIEFRERGYNMAKIKHMLHTIEKKSLKLVGEDLMEKKKIKLKEDEKSILYVMEEKARLDYINDIDIKNKNHLFLYKYLSKMDKSLHKNEKPCEIKIKNEEL